MGKKAERQLGGGKGKAPSPSHLMVIYLSLCQIKIFAFPKLTEKCEEKNKIMDIKPLSKAESPMLI